MIAKVVSQGTRKGWHKRVAIAEMTLEDISGKKVKAIWFSQAYMAKKFAEGALVRLSGKSKEYKGSRSFTNPAIELASDTDLSGPLFSSQLPGNRGLPGNLVPVYPESRGISSLWLTYAIQKVLKSGIVEQHRHRDPIPTDILTKYKLPSLAHSLIYIHSPKRESDARAARKRFSFQEIFFIQIARQKARNEYETAGAYKISSKDKLEVPFRPTQAQNWALEIILNDMGRAHPMMRLLEGDVGSGKTYVAAAAAHAVIQNNLQVAYMAPTEILAKQHFESFISLLSPPSPSYGKRGIEGAIQIGLLTGSECRKFPSKINHPSITLGAGTHISRTQLLKWIADGSMSIVIGTHALIQESVKFKKLALSIIDEQHRFGVEQRALLVARGRNADQTLNNAEGRQNKEKTELLYEQLTYKIRGAAFEVRKTLGGGHPEVVYQRALEEEFRRIGLQFAREKRIDIYYKEKKIGLYQPDFLVEDSVIVELKALPFLGDTVASQTWKYLKGSQYKLALIVNFGPTQLDIKRLVYDEARSPSASIPHSSAFVPHLLSMTATPIPRTLAFTIYGDLDLTLLDESPPGRKPIITKIVQPKERANVYEHIRREIKSGRQAYVICPRISEPDPEKELALETKDVMSETEKLGLNIFPELVVASLHGKMSAKEKDEIMSEFANNEINILVATSVIEVGVNVPNATIIIIEGAERFGLAQLHQLRGRVLRSSYQAHCYLFPSTTLGAGTTSARLKAIEKAKSGFDLAEEDLKLRGPGSLVGIKQSGISDVGMEALLNLKMVEAARTEARAILESDPALANHPLLAERLISQNHHFE